MTNRLALSLAFAIALISASHFLSHALRAKQDLFWVYSLGFAWFQPDEYRSALIKHVPAEVESDRRKLMQWNYPMSAVTSYVSAKLSLPLQWAIGVSFMAAFIIGLAIAFLGAKTAPLPFTLVVSFYALLGFLPGPVPTDHLFLLHGTNAFLNVLAILGNSGEVYSPLSVWQRNTALLIIIGALALRWNGKRFYPLLASIALFHINFAVMAVGLFLAADLLKRQKEIAKLPDAAVLLASCALAAASCSIMYVAFETSDPWAWPAAFSQAAGRFLAIAHVVAAFGMSWWACKWLREKNASNAVIAVALVALPMTVYGTAGSWWRLGPDNAASFSKVQAEPIAEGLTRPYYLVIQDLTGDD